MATMPFLLRSLALFLIVACSGCASWHYRKDYKAQNTSGTTSGALQPLAQDLANVSLHGWNFNSRW